MKIHNAQSRNNKHSFSKKGIINIFISLIIMVLLSSCVSSQSLRNPNSTPIPYPVFYIDNKLGSDSNHGSQAQPWKTIQKCLDLVQPGGTCQILNGIYYESLTLKTSGTSTAPITIKCAVEKNCTINSNISKALITGGRIHFYIIDGLEFISKYNATNQLDASLDFGKNIWDGETTKDGGNNGFVLQNCYIEGAVIFYGHNNLVQNCELNGNYIWYNGITERMATSHDNIFRNNVVHDYKIRGIWSHQATDNTTIENNTIYNIGSDSEGGNGVDCDGAYVAVTRCNIINNHIYNIPGQSVILLENAFNSIIENNVIHDGVTGIGIINYNIENGDGFHAKEDYKLLITNTIIRNNVIYNMTQNGLNCKAVVGNKFTNNTIYNIKVFPGYWGAIGMAEYGGFYCNKWEIKNNIVSDVENAVWYETSPTNPTDFKMDYNLYDLSINEVKFSHIQRNPEAWSNWNFSEWKAGIGLDTHSILASPLFISATTGDFKLQADSPACIGGENGTHMGAFPCQ